MANNELQKGTILEESIRRLTHLNGVPIATLEARMRPFSVTGHHYGMYSYDGFLGADESLVDLLISDNRVVIDAGFTHENLAHWLEIAMSGIKEGYFYFVINEMRFSCKHVGTHSKGQTSPFANPDLQVDPEDISWDGEYEVINLDTGRRVSFTLPMRNWILKYGFYQGHGTQFRVDPRKVIDTFTNPERVIPSRTEYKFNLLERYETQGWASVWIGHPSKLPSRYELLLGSISKYSEDVVGTNKVLQILEDKQVIITILGSYDAERQMELRTVIFDSLTHKVIGTLSTFNLGEVTRQIEDVSVVIKVHHAPGYSDKHDCQITLREGGSAVSWSFENRGNLLQVNAYEFLKEYGNFTGTSEDQFQVFRNSHTEFIIQNDGSSGYVYYLRKQNLRTGESTVVTLSVDVVANLLGISMAEASEGVSQVQDIRVDSKGVVSGLALVNGQAYPFQI